MFQIGKAKGQYDRNDKWPHQYLPGMNFSQQPQERENVLHMMLPTDLSSARFGSEYTQVGMIQRRLTRSLSKDDTHIGEAFHVKKKKKDSN